MTRLHNFEIHLEMVYGPQLFFIKGSEELGDVSGEIEVRASLMSFNS